MTTTSSLGIGAGVDLQSMLSSIMAAERAPITALEKKITTTNSKISLYGELSSKLDALRTAGNTLQFPSQLSATTAVSSDKTVLTASAAFYATPGSYAVNVTQLATAQKSFSYAYDTGTTFGQGSLSFTVGGVAQPVIDLTDQASYTLQEIGAKINDANMGVTATVISGTDGDRLILTGNKTGAGNDFSFTSTVAAPDSVPSGTTQHALTDLDTSPSLAVSSAADAIITIDGVEVSSDTNTFSNAIGGLTFTALKAGSSATVTVQTDATKIEDAVQNFVDSYNAVVKLIKDNSDYDLTTKTAELFNGDSAARGIRDVLTNARSTIPSELSGASIKTLSALGVTIQQNGLFSLDSTTLQQAIETAPDDVTTAIAAYGKSFSDAVNNMMGATGLLTSRVSSLNTSVDRYEDNVTSLENRVALIEKRYRAQFTSLDTLLSSMQTTSSYLTQQLANLSSS